MTNKTIHLPHNDMFNVKRINLNVYKKLDMFVGH